MKKFFAVALMSFALLVSTGVGGVGTDSVNPPVTGGITFDD
jgi:hypothetical protein